MYNKIEEKSRQAIARALLAEVLTAAFCRTFLLAPSAFLGGMVTV
jgi:hypothetical protein